VGARRFLAFARPRAASELLALVLACLAVTSLGLLVLRREGTGFVSGPVAWSAILLLAAATARFLPWWRAHAGRITAVTTRAYLASVLFGFVALSVTWHVLGGSLGLGSAYLLFGPLSESPAAPLVFVAMCLASVALMLNLPVHAWTVAGLRSTAGVIGRASRSEVVEAAVVDHPVAPADESGHALPQVELDRAPDAESPRTEIGTTEAQTASPLSERGPLTPPIDIFIPGPKGPATPADLEHKAKRIQETLASFNVGARVVGHHCGPVVTQFDVQPDRGVKVRRITELQNDLALSLAAPTIRIQAPVPGKPFVGIEIPNASATMVALRDLLESEEYRSLQSPLKLVLGKDVAGSSAVIDLARMPHLLIAGATGSGKSACINALISCLLFQNTPEQVRIMMIDPKMVELTVYNGVPHLLSPVVTQTDKVVGVLQWAVREMERRYQLFADATVRNIQRYNEKCEANECRKLPYIVLVVDELADLMMVAPDDVESAICRLAQLARAAGIHVVIATQRPSVDVVTGLIKANFPARIAFAMTSQVDSRTILDTVGAEKLLGRGDMLYLPPDASRPMRLQGSYLSDGEIERLVEFWKSSPLQGDVQQVSDEEFAAAEKEAGNVDDELLAEAMRVVRDYQHASVSLLQRRLKVGYSRAARLMDQLERHGIVGPADGSKQRPVLQESSSSET